MSNLIEYATNEMNRYLATSVNESMKEYDKACLEAAIDILKMFDDQNHSGFRLNRTLGFVNRLLDFKPLVDIHDEDFTEKDDMNENEYRTPYYSGIWKYVDPKTGEVTYRDIERVRVSIDTDTSNNLWSNVFVTRIIDKMFPITMPYYPMTSARYIVHEDDYLINPKNGYYDTIHLKYGIDKSTGNKFEINRYFTEIGSEKRGQLREITKEEFDELMKTKE